MTTSSCTSIYFKLRTVSMHATSETETTGVPVRHIQRLLLETFRADGPDIISYCRFRISGCWHAGRSAVLRIRRRPTCTAGIVPVPKTVSETNDSRPILLFCRRSTPLRCRLSLRCSRTHVHHLRLSLRCSTMRL